MGTVIGLFVLAGFDFYINRKTGLHLPESISKKYQERKKD